MPEGDASLGATPRTTLKRRAERGCHDAAVVYAILDEALVCHVAVHVDGGPSVLPVAHARISDQLYLHGARANRLLGEIATGAQACVAVTLLDGLVFGRSWFHHSMNYRSAVLYGCGSEVADPDEKRAALATLVEKAGPGRSSEARPPTAEELRSTLVVRLPIVEASAKVRTGPPLDGPEQYADDCWAGELPLRLAALPARDDRNLGPAVAPSRAVDKRARTMPAVRAEFGLYERSRGDFTVSTDAVRIDFSFVHRFLAEDSYWARGIEPGRLRQAMSHSLSFGLYRGSQQIGFARVLTDLGRLAYLGDVFVAKDARGQGLGTWLVASVLKHPALEMVDRWILGTADAHRLYERFGFERAETGRYMVRRRSDVRDDEP